MWDGEYSDGAELDNKTLVPSVNCSPLSPIDGRVGGELVLEPVFHWHPLGDTGPGPDVVEVLFLSGLHHDVSVANHLAVVFAELAHHELNSDTRPW